jgi:hypothetical protein
LTDWRRRKTGAHETSGDGGNPAGPSDPQARTIKVRGHETIVIRRSRPRLPQHDQSHGES